MDDKNKKPCPIEQKQLHLFSIPSVPGNTLLSYDLDPRFLHDRAKKRIDLSQTPNHNPISIKINEDGFYVLHAHTFHLPDPSGETDEFGEVCRKPMLIYPSTRESLIEDCLIHFVRNGEFSIERGEPGYLYYGHEFGVCFTYYQLRKALKSHGKEYRLDELKEGLNVLSYSAYEYHSKTGSVTKKEYIVGNIQSIPNPYPNDRIRNDRLVFAPFTETAKHLLFAGKYRTYDAQCAMSMKSPVARYLYKQISHYWQNANNNNQAGSIKSVDQNETIAGSGCPLLSNPTKLKNNMLKALKELAIAGVIQDLDESVDVVPLKEGRRIVDVRFMIRPTSNFIKQQIQGYQRLMASQRIGQELEAKRATVRPMLG
jgi:hypothetical protein